MQKMSMMVAATALALGGCVVGPYDDGYGYTSYGAAPALPGVVELYADPFYYQGGYHYHYDNDRWRYARSRSGPWVDLPRNHYPRETRYHGRRDRDGDGRRDRDRDGDRDGRRGGDRGGNYDRHPDRNPVDRP